MIFSIW